MELMRWKPKPRRMDPILMVAGWISIIGSVAALAFRIPIVDSAAAVAVASFLGMALLWLKLHPGIRKFLTAPGVRWVVDGVVSIGIAVFMGSTITGILAGAVAGIWVSMGLEWQAHKLWGGGA